MTAFTFPEVAAASAEPVRIVLDEGEGWSEVLMIECVDGLFEVRRTLQEDRQRDRIDFIALAREHAVEAARAILAMAGEGP